MSRKNDVTKIIAAEAFKLARLRTSLALPAVITVFAVVAFLGLELAARRDWIGVPGGFFLAASTISWVGNIIVLISVVTTSFVISQEFALGTVKSTWIRPLNRRAWYRGKILTSCVIISALFLLAVAVAVLLAALRFGFTDLLEKNYLVHTAQSLGTRLVLTVALVLWSLWAVTVVVATLASVFNHAGGSIACSVGLGVLMTVLAMFPSARPFLLSTYVGLPADQMVAMSKGLPLPVTWNDLVWRTLLASGSWMVVAYVIGQRIIDKKEISA